MLCLQKIPKLPVTLGIVIILVVFFGAYLPILVQQFFYSLSLSIKELLMFVLPIIVFSLLFSSIVNMSMCVLQLILLLIPTLCLSNFTTTMVAYFVGNSILTNTSFDMVLSSAQHNLQPLWQFTIPRLIHNEWAMLSAFVLGAYCIIRGDSNKIEWKISQKLALVCSKLATNILQKAFIPIIPLFILGFILKLQYDGVLILLIHNYAFVFLTIVLTQISYVSFLYGVGSTFHISKWLQYIKTMLPAGITGFTTMSSAAAMPVTLIATEKNTSSLQIPRLVVPITVNIHLIGDCIAIPIMALAIMVSFGVGLPDFHTYLVFAGYFVLAKFAVAAVPGGGIIVMVPILERQLGFNAEMVSLITALYILLDSVTTSMNVMGNGAFSIIMKNIFVKFGSYTEQNSSIQRS